MSDVIIKGFFMVKIKQLCIQKTNSVKKSSYVMVLILFFMMFMNVTDIFGQENKL